MASGTVPVQLRIGTRGSPLALWQAREVQAQIAAARGWPIEAIEIVVIRTSGDMIQDRALSQAGGKGLFTKEIDSALLERSVQIAVHSAKDMPTRFPDSIVIAGYLARADVRDALISARAASLEDLPQGATVGTASLRRQALIKRQRPDIVTTLLRGNVETRLGRAESGEIDATLLAAAGLHRLGLAHRISAYLDADAFPPAVGQGAIAITALQDDEAALSAVAAIANRETGIALAAERAFLTVLDGSCRTPIAGLARVEGDHVRFDGTVLSADGGLSFSASRSGSPSDAAGMGEDAARDILARAPADILAH